MKVADIAVALLMTVVNVVSTAVLHGGSDVDRAVDALGLALAATAGIVLLLRRRRPLVTLAASAVVITTYLLLSYPYGPVMVSLSIAIYGVGRYEPLARAVPAAIGALALVLTHLAVNPAALPGLYGLIPATAFAAIPLAIGVVVRSNHETVQRERAELIRRRVSDERLRVAQEVHDVVGHGLAAIKMQADIALHLLARKPGQAEIALEAISRTSTEALDELRATLTVVRSDRSPVPGLERLPELRTRMSEAGLQVRVDTTGAPRHLPVAVDLVGYRVVQESLTNVLRHSDTKQATVKVGYQDDTVLISVSNPSSAPQPAVEAGFGIPGMRERVTSLGGEFSAGPTDDGRFEVRAAIPTGGAR